ncbi:LysE family translocator [Brachybacterium sp. GCM10030267]|uniref:LysE family translocator n=1 Tax=Brachybacterium sp. GCM10030267 TaxID=3273381 RepID=UPI00360FF295
MIEWHVFLPAAVAMASIPGANQVLGLRNAAVVGARYAAAGVAGRFAAFAVLALLVVVGLGAVLARSAVAFEVLRWAGVVYLVWLGVSTIRNAGAGERHPDLRREERGAVAARREFITALTNPKALLLFASFLPQFMPTSAPASLLLVLAAVYIGVEALAAAAYIAAGSAMRRPSGELRRPRRRLDQVAGASFLGFGAYLATSHRP